MKKIILFIFSAVIFCSCATLLNSPTEKLTIITSEPSNITIIDDTLTNSVTHNDVVVNRSKDPLHISVFNDSITKNISVNSKNSLAYWLNLHPIAWVGFLADKNNPKRYAYPKIVYIDLESKKDNYFPYIPLSSPLSINNIIKFTPFQLVGFINPSAEISYERKTGGYFTSQIMTSYLLPFSFVILGQEIKPNASGYRIAFEEKIYLKRSAPTGPYIGFELNYIEKEYRAIGDFGVKDIYSDPTYNNTNYTDTFGVQKQVLCYNLKFGFHHIDKRTSVDFYFGMGLRNQVVTHSDRINPNDEMEAPRFFSLKYLANLNGSYWAICFPINLRIGWAF